MLYISNLFLSFYYKFNKKYLFGLSKFDQPPIFNFPFEPTTPSDKSVLECQPIRLEGLLQLGQNKDVAWAHKQGGFKDKWVTVR